MLNSSCEYFPLDRPCDFHKLERIKCNRCSHYKKASSFIDGKRKILIIKLGAMGDVLRTTFLLEGLKEKYKKIHISWIVEPISVPILQNNPFIDRIIPFDKNINSILAKEIFDLTINLDLSPESLALATLSLSKNKIGFWLSADRKIVCSNNYAKNWLLMSAFDDVKKSNKKTYQWWMSKIVGLKRSDYEIIVPLTDASLKKAKKFAQKNGLNKKVVIGINPGAGERWKLKRWTTGGYIQLIDKLNEKGLKILLLGGKDDASVIKTLKKKLKDKVINTGTNHSIPDFFAFVNLCDIVICSDTLAMHIATGLRKKVIAIFGPTSASEIEMYHRGLKIISPLECQCCYKTDCDVKPNCMQAIKPETILAAVEKLL